MTTEQVSIEHSEETLERILSEAERLFSLYGYKGVALSQIAEACAISKPALYYYFRDKQELYTQVLLQQVVRHQREFQHLLAGKTVRVGLGDLAAYLRVNTTYDVAQMRADMRSELDEERRRIVGQAYAEGFFGPIHALFRSGVASGELRSDTDTELAAWMFMNAMSAICNPGNSLAPLRPDGRRIEDTLIDTLLDGIINPNNKNI